MDYSDRPERLFLRKASPETEWWWAAGERLNVDDVEYVRADLIVDVEVCAHCGLILPDEREVAAHVRQCKKNPMVQEIAQLKFELESETAWAAHYHAKWQDVLHRLEWERAKAAGAEEALGLALDAGRRDRERLTNETFAANLWRYNHDREKERADRLERELEKLRMNVEIRNAQSGYHAVDGEPRGEA